MQKKHNVLPLILFSGMNGELTDHFADILNQMFRKETAAGFEDILMKSEIELPDVIIIDAGSDQAIELCRQIKSVSVFATIPIIACSLSDDPNIRLETLKAGCNDFLTTGLTPEEVICRVTRNSEMNQHISELIAANLSKDKLLSIIAHDLKTPFTAIIGYSDLLVQSYADFNTNEIKEFIKSINSISKQQFELLENMLQWSRMQTGRMEFIPILIDLVNITGGILELFRENAAQKNITLSSRHKGNTQIVADKNMLETILRNLVSNAIKFTYSGGSVLISTERFDHYTEIQIQDDGMGMDEDTVLDLFSIDSHHSTKGTADEKGTGLGLVLVKELLDLCGGDIRVTSQLHTGTTFTVTVPNGKRRPF